jgi:N-glycosylase/DNA lyase
MNKNQFIFVEDFSLKESLECGQFFSYEKIGNIYYIILEKFIFKVKQEGNLLFYEGVNKDFLIYFFSLDYDLRLFKSKCDVNDKYLMLSIEKYWGLRIIRGELWQTIIGFLCSSASNISKIKMNMKLLSEYFGEKVYFDSRWFFLFPKEGSLKNLNLLLKAKTGYRANYIYEFNNFVLENPNFFLDLKEASYEEAMKMLMGIKGIGEKIANCICLFSLGHMEAFPIDTWMKKVIIDWYLDENNLKKNELSLFVSNYFRQDAGLKQQYLFHYARNKI